VEGLAPRSERLFGFREAISRRVDAFLSSEYLSHLPAKRAVPYHVGMALAPPSQRALSVAVANPTDLSLGTKCEVH
jgi:hypothetical protein